MFVIYFFRSFIFLNYRKEKEFVKRVVVILNIVFGRSCIVLIFYSNFVIMVIRLDEGKMLVFFDNFVDGLFYECGVICIDRVLKFV